MKNQVSKVAVKIMTSLALISTLGLSLAHAGDLGDVMKAMNTDLKTITAQVDDAAKNDSSAALADDFAKVAATSKTFMADSIAQAPAAQQAAMKADFDQMIDQSVTLGTQLAAAFRAGNAAVSKDLLNQLAALKKDGHTKYRQ